MQKEPLEELVARIVTDLNVDKLDKRVDTYVDMKSKYVNLRPRVKVKVELTNGKSAEIDVSDYFEGVVK